MSEKQDQSQPRPRPVSPHFQAYHLPLQALLSFGHRVSGVVLSAGMFVIVGYVWLAAFAPENFALIKGLLATPAGRLALFLWTGSFCYHLFTGLRHMIWDTGAGLEPPFYRASNWVILLGVPVCTVALFVLSGGPP